ncbi:sensory rhodopsin transducer [Alkalihalobacillus sp. LMS39]|uniref:sensory rhodopsin transducer n=1 Tax=Alkalihalobacillus sp. LMS39 TaxID=2924032 RepID=UPI001FB3ACF2|nr:sensory rhodopsin transducer [Alkalihalobacillus sp. LMS39]UOE94954.1 sensory rhodopsin transducer [Alkalihalobacillus sp. LMS39]
MTDRQKGSCVWYIPDGYIPPLSSGTLESHESICVLNCYQQNANLKITIYFEDRDPIEQIPFVVKGKRTSHIRTSKLEKEGQRIPKEVPYAIEVESDVPIIVQYSRLDSTQQELALMSTMAHPLA